MPEADTSLCNATKYSSGNMTSCASSTLLGGRTLSIKTLLQGRMKQFSVSVDGLRSGFAGRGSVERASSSISRNGKGTQTSLVDAGLEAEVHVAGVDCTAVCLTLEA